MYTKTKSSEALKETLQKLAKGTFSPIDLFRKTNDEQISKK